MQIRLKKLIGKVLLPLLVGGLSFLLTRNGMATYTQTVQKPPLTPPPWVFGAVWTVLYLLMGIADYLVSEQKAPLIKKQRAQTAYGIQLALNFLWPLIFFNLSAYLPAFFILIALFLAVAVTAYLFFRLSKPAGVLLIPYLLWLILAGYLNYGVWQLN